MRILSAIVLATALVAGCSSMSMSSGPTKTMDGMLTGPNNMTLYTFDRDTAGNGKSMCNGPCATLWPALMADDMAKPMGDYTVIMRDDGKKQWAYKGKPLYYFSRDTKAGEKTGDGFNKVWALAKP